MKKNYIYILKSFGNRFLMCIYLGPEGLDL